MGHEVGNFLIRIKFTCKFSQTSQVVIIASPGTVFCKNFEKNLFPLSFFLQNSTFHWYLNYHDPIQNIENFETISIIITTVKSLIWHEK